MSKRKYREGERWVSFAEPEYDSDDDETGFVRARWHVKFMERRMKLEADKKNMTLEEYWQWLKKHIDRDLAAASEATPKKPKRPLPRDDEAPGAPDKRARNEE